MAPQFGYPLASAVGGKIGCPQAGTPYGETRETRSLVWLNAKRSIPYPCVRMVPFAKVQEACSACNTAPTHQSF